MSIRMLLFHDIEETEYFWADFIFGNSRSVPDVLDSFHRVLADEGMSFRGLGTGDFLEGHRIGAAELVNTDRFHRHLRRDEICGK